MNDRLQQNLSEARAALLGAQERLAKFRRLGCLNSNDHALRDHALLCVVDAIDRAWDAQCMAAGSL